MADIETRCRSAIENLKSYRFDGKISCDDYHEFVSLIGSLPQYVAERNELVQLIKEMPSEPIPSSGVCFGVGMK